MNTSVSADTGVEAGDMEVHRSPRAWRVADIAPLQPHFLMLNADQQAEVVRCARSFGDAALTDIEAGADRLPGLAGTMQTVASALREGCGFAVVGGFPVDALVDGSDWHLAEAGFWALAQTIGIPDRQDISGQRLHHVRRARPAEELITTQSARAYETDVEVDFHGDGSDALMFLCLRQGKSGGVSRLVSAEQAYDDVMRSSPELAAALLQPFHFDARGQRGDGARTQYVPIATPHDGRMSFLYKRGYIELAQRFDDVPSLTQKQIAAMDAFDAALHDPANVLEFRMQPGQVLFVNNYAVFHARTAFEDYDEEEKRRHFLRIWMTLRDGPPVPDVYGDTREFSQSWAYHNREA